MMKRRFANDVGHAMAVTLLLTVGACGGATTGTDSQDLGLLFVDGPADHVVGAPIPTFRVWVVDLFQRRFTGLEGGTLNLDLVDPSGAVQTGFASVPLSFGQGTVTPSTSLQAADGYLLRARFDGTTADSPPFSVVAAPDVVEMNNPSADEVGLIVDGANNIGRLRDSIHRATTAQVNVGVLNSGGLTHSVALFAPDRRPERIPVAWTPAADVVSIDLIDPVQIPVTVWIISGDFATEKSQLELLIPELNQEWSRERAGVALGDVDYMDATAFTSPFENFAVPMGVAPFAGLASGVGRAAGRFNIYVATQVRDATMTLVGGFAEVPGTAMVVTTSALASEGARVLGHEFGHNFGLRDTDNVGGFVVDGNMMRTGQSSMALTEGQTFRAHFDQSSPLRLYRADTSPSTSCQPFAATGDCPDAGLRIWSEAEPAGASTSR